MLQAVFALEVASATRDVLGDSLPYARPVVLVQATLDRKSVV